jgi:hypothetical protein
MRSLPRRRYLPRQLLVVLTACAIASAIAAGSAQAATATDSDNAAARGADWIRGQQLDNGSLGDFGGDWAMSALAAAGVSAADVRTSATNPTAQDYYQGVWADPSAGPGGSANDAARATLAAWAGGIQPSKISARLNLVSRLASMSDGTQLGDPSLLNDDIFGGLALWRVRAPRPIVADRAAWVVSHGTVDGGWSWASTATTADPDTTGAAIGLLCAAGRTADDPAMARALDYLHSRQDAATGGFSAPFLGVNTDTTAWIVGGLNRCGIDADSSAWRSSLGKTPFDFLIAQQNSEGSFQWQAGDGSKNLYSTQAATRALAREDFSAEPPARSSGPRIRPAPAVASGSVVPVTVVIDHGDGISGSGRVRACEVRTPVGSPVSVLLHRAVGGDTPASCVTGWKASADGQRVILLNGVKEQPGARIWRIKQNGTLVSLTTPVTFGGLVFLNYRAP